ncbi:MAG TPA: hypothetical protein VET65_01780 [Candidatus Limnocylindrales bacterium]|nr:hypothetical protein [Candidatus Limnocylindrales bacterium]
MLRRALIAYGVLAVLVAAVLLTAGAVVQLAVYLLLNGVVILAALGFERSRYRPRLDPTARPQKTGERFIDPVTHRLVEVRYDPRTGKREYVDVPEGER